MTFFDHIQNILQPLIADYLTWVILAVVAWFMRLLPERWRMEVEAHHRNALHKALDSGVGLAIDTLQKHPAVWTADQGVSQVITYTYGSVPRAIRKLGPSPELLEQMARSKLRTRLDDLFNRDRLTDELKLAGVEEAGLDD